ncbi:WSSV557 [White spot syndrome virus]|uniref:WSSV557 n=1 Tax=White spot syndrome virus TaxID=342409 RepID=A0A2I6SCI5_9VIRU|nr:WSSV557 [White spot syndrome virus]
MRRRGGKLIQIEVSLVEVVVLLGAGVSRNACSRNSQKLMHISGAIPFLVQSDIGPTQRSTLRT